eukprot:m.1328649 g.1328649  ORF g.1328649 m.1328649 type:complete len:1252 (+) comp24859_c0_seq2:131-3886(+)
MGGFGLSVHDFLNSLPFGEFINDLAIYYTDVLGYYWWQTFLSVCIFGILNAWRLHQKFVSASENSESETEADNAADGTTRRRSISSAVSTLGDLDRGKIGSAISRQSSVSRGNVAGKKGRKLSLPERTKNKIITLKAKGIRNARLLFGARAPQEAKVNTRVTPETMLNPRFDSGALFTSSQATDIARGMAVFLDLDEEQFHELYRQMDIVVLAPHEHLFKLGDVDDSAFYVKSGVLDVTAMDYTGDDSTSDLCTLTKGDTLSSVLSVLDVFVGNTSRYRTLSARAGPGGATLLRMQSSALKSVVPNSHELLRQLACSAVRQFTQVDHVVLVEVFGLFKEATRSAAQRLERRKRNKKAQEHISDASKRDDDSETPDLHPETVENAATLAVPETGESKLDVILREKAVAIAALSKLLGCSEAALQNATLSTVPKNTIIFEVGDMQHELVYLFRGELQEMAFSGTDDDEDSDADMFDRSAGPRAPDTAWFGNHVFPGGVVGYLGLLSDVPSITSVFASSESTILTVPQDIAEQLLKNEPKVAIELTRMFLDGLSPLARQLDFALNTVHLDSGKALYEQGSDADSLYVVVNGRVRAVHENPLSQRKNIIHEFGRSDLIGGIETLEHSTRVSSVLAVRDSVLVKIPAGVIHEVRRHYPHVLQRLRAKLKRHVDDYSQQHKLRLPRHSAGRGRSGRIGTVAVTPSSEDVPIDKFAKLLVTALKNSEASVLHLTKENVKSLTGIDPNVTHNIKDQQRLLAWLATQERQYAMVVYQADFVPSAWTERCFRQADFVYTVGLGDAEPTLSPMERRLEASSLRATVELVLLHPPETEMPHGTALWLNLRPWCKSHFHVRFICDTATHNARDAEEYLMSGTCSFQGSDFTEKVFAGMHRLARRLQGKSVGLVLGGGGAKGFAHLGAIKTMQEKGIPIDYIGGTSIGAFVSGAFAMEEGNLERVEERCYAMAKRMQYLLPNILDLTYPYVSMLTGRAFNRVIQKSLEEDGAIGKETLIEDLWIPMFCVSTDISAMQVRAHLSGCLWRYTRASMSLSGYLPPICDPDNGHLLLDGGYVNNLPVDLMRKTMAADRIIAVDVESKESADFTNYGDALSGWLVLWKTYMPFFSQKNLRVPQGQEIQSRLAYISSNMWLNRMFKVEDFEYWRPPVDPYQVLQWDKAHEISDMSYKFLTPVCQDVLTKWEQVESVNTRALSGSTLQREVIPDDFEDQEPSRSKSSVDTSNFSRRGDRSDKMRRVKSVVFE